MHRKLREAPDKLVIAGLVPAIHVFAKKKGVDARAGKLVQPA
jgi:hypothetical protein